MWRRIGTSEWEYRERRSVAGAVVATWVMSSVTARAPAASDFVSTVARCRTRPRAGTLAKYRGSGRFRCDARPIAEPVRCSGPVMDVVSSLVRVADMASGLGAVSALSGDALVAGVGLEPVGLLKRVAGSVQGQAARRDRRWMRCGATIWDQRSGCGIASRRGRHLGGLGSDP